MAEMRIVLPPSGMPLVTVDDYRKAGGFAALEKALAMGPRVVIAEVEKSGLRGRGGAGFSTAKKWVFVADAVGEAKHVVCNASEGEPGVHKDKFILRNNPFQVLEGLAIAAHAVGAGDCIVNIKFTSRAMQPELEARMKDFISASGLEGKLAMRLHIGPASYLSGEETAMVHAINGGGAIPTRKPPYPAQSGVAGQPTLINNVETLANIPAIISRGGDWFSGIGTATSKGTMVISSSANPALVREFAFGTSFKEVLSTLEIDVSNAKAVLAGPSGGFVPPGLFDLPLCREAFREKGASVGCGGLLAIPGDVCIVRQTAEITDFFGKSSCGQCHACKVGMGADAHALLAAIADGKGKEGDLATLESLCEAASSKDVICGLAPGAAHAVRTAVRFFPDEFAAHFNGSPSCGGKAVDFLIHSH